MSVEASDLYGHNYRGTTIYPKYCGMIPASKELTKLREYAKSKENKRTKKETSDAIINVKFNSKVKSAEEIIKISKKSIEKNIKKLDKLKISSCLDDKREERENAIKKLEEDNERLRKSIENKTELVGKEEWEEVKIDDLRFQMYEEGFSMTIIDKKTKKPKTTNYKIYKRSSSKSRTGQVLAIRENLYDKMMNWSWTGLDFKESNVDYPSLLAYESLIGSGSESSIEINPDNILMVQDVKQIFKRKCNVIRSGEDNRLNSFEEEADLESNLFDGQSLLHYTYFEETEGKSMMLLRNHFFKSAAFACDIQGFLRDYFVKLSLDIDYDEWQIPTMFNTDDTPDTMYAKNIKMITCPSSLKELKFSKVVGSQLDMWTHWKQVVQSEDNIFAICKYEKKSKHGVDENGKVLHRMSYQMLNSLPANKEDVEVLASHEKKFIDELKNDDDVFIEYIKNNVHETNSNQMWVNLYSLNSDIVGESTFRNFRSKQIGKYLKYIRGGKIRLNGDYCYLLGNGVEMLYHAVGVDVLFKDYEPVLTGNQIYTKLFDFGQEYACFRNPHTSPSNVLVAENIQNKMIDRYFGHLSDNVVMVNSISFPIQRILSGADFDSDSMIVFDNSKLLELAKKCYSVYNVCQNAVDNNPATYSINNIKKALIDNTLSKSQFLIGRIVNSGQWAMSRYWESKRDEEAKEYLKIVDVCTVLSEIAIDSAKKTYDINLEDEVGNVESKLKGYKPIFFQYVSQNKNIKNKIRKHDCPMDYLAQVLTIDAADYHKNADFKSLLKIQNFTKRKRKQISKIIKYVTEMDDHIKHIESLYDNISEDEDKKKEKNNLIIDVHREYKYLISKLKVETDTMYALLILADREEKDKFTRILSVLSETHTYIFNKAFKKGEQKTPK